MLLTGILSFGVQSFFLMRIWRREFLSFHLTLLQTYSWDCGSEQ